MKTIYIIIAILIAFALIILMTAIKEHLDHLEISASYERQITELHHQLDTRETEIKRLNWFKVQWYELMGR